MRNNGMIEMLYEAAAGAPDENGISKFDEQKLRRNLDANHKLFKRNRDIFEDGEPKLKSCPRYDPCPICDKCRNKASHLYVACQDCRIPICSHTYEDRAKMIKRENFVITVDQDTMDSIKALDAKRLDEEINEMMKKDEDRAYKNLIISQVNAILESGD